MLTIPLTFVAKRSEVKITIVCGHYLPSLGYLEVHLSRAFAMDGHDVSVVTTTAVPSYIRHLHKGFSENPDGVEVIRLKPAFSMGQIVVARGIKKAIQKIQPNLVIAIGLGKRFPKPVFDLNLPVISLFGDNSWSYSKGKNFKTRLLFNLLKKSTYQKAANQSNSLVAYTPESFEAAAGMLSGKSAEILKKQGNFISLGFWPDEFFFDRVLRDRKRRELDIQQKDVIIITATRLVAEKELEKAIGFFEKLPDNYKWLLVGSAEDDFAKQFEQDLKRKIGKDRFLLLPYQSRNGINALYNAADLALYTVPAISIFEALGTGLPLIIPRHASLSHIAESYAGTLTYGKFPTDAADKISNVNYHDRNRSQAAKDAQDQFSWQEISRKLLGYARVSSN